MSQKASGEADSGTDSSGKEFVCDDCGKEYSRNSNLAKHRRKEHLEDDVSCPLCPTTVATEHGLKVHIGKEHEEQKKPDTPCPDCGEVFHSNRGVKIHQSKAHNKSPSGVEVNCDWCDEITQKPESEIREHNFCSRDCYADWLSENRSKENHPDWKGGKVTVECSVCGDSKKIGRYESKRTNIHWCSTECESEWMSNNRTGENHPRWKGGTQKNYRGDWYQVRKDRLEKDGYECTICGKTEEEIGSEPSVHHIIPVSHYDNPNDAHTIENTRTVCKSCHNLIEGWFLFPDTDA